MIVSRVSTWIFRCHSSHWMLLLSFSFGSNRRQWRWRQQLWRFQVVNWRWSNEENEKFRIKRKTWPSTSNRYAVRIPWEDPPDHKPGTVRVWCQAVTVESEPKGDTSLELVYPFSNSSRISQTCWNPSHEFNPVWIEVTSLLDLSLQSYAWCTPGPSCSKSG